MIELEVTFERRLYGSPEGGFSVFSAKPLPEYKDLVSVDERFQTLTISGDYFIDEDELYKPFKVTINEDTSGRYANSYKLEKLHYTLPDTPEAQWAYLLTQVTRLEYKSFYETFPRNTLIINEILKGYEVIMKVKGFGEISAKKLYNKILQDQGKAALFNEYGQIEGIGPAIINKLYKWKPDITQTIKEINKNPFVVMEIDGIGFGIADKIRGALGMPIDGRERCLYGLAHFLDLQFQRSGNTYEHLTTTIKSVAIKLNVYPEVLAGHLKSIIGTKHELTFGIRTFGSFISTLTLYEAETVVYKRINSMINEKENITDEETWTKLRLKATKDYNDELTDEQINFVNSVNENNVSLLIGPGGVGKSWVTKVVYDMLADFGYRTLLLAPTARAAHVMGEYVGSPGSTIHRALYLPYLLGSVTDYDVYIIDEASMVDSELMSMVLKTLNPTARLIIIGDDFQLPSVGPGNILFNFIHDIEVPMTRLTKVFRQDEGSYITQMAQEIRDNKFYLDETLNIVDYKDITLINTTDLTKMNASAIDEYKISLNKYKQENLMLLTPVNNGEAGRHTLNKTIQDIANSRRDEGMVFGKNLEDESLKTYFKEGDFITVKKNNYEIENLRGDQKEIINGDIGHIVSATDKVVIIKIEDDMFALEKEDVKEYIEHAWAITIHKSQGGQANEVIILIPPNSSKYVSANMIYTAITRATEHCTVIGSFREINKSVKQFVNYNRKTMINLKSDLIKNEKHL